MNKLSTLIFTLIILISLNIFGNEPKSYPEKTRILILTDIENEPDDAMSMVRFLLYANQFDVEGIVATTSCLHEKDYPTHAFLKEKIKKGYPDFGMAAVGEPALTRYQRVIVTVKP